MSIFTQPRIVFGIALLLYACGGSAPVIKHRLSMDMLSNSPADVRAPVAEAYRAHYEAKLKLDHLTFLLSDLKYALGIAKAEKSKAKQSMKIAKLESKRNALTFKVTQMNAAKSELASMAKRRDAQSMRIRYLQAQRRFLRKSIAHGKASVYHSEARFELAKAKLAKERNTIPRGFKMAAFVAQEKRTGAVASRKAARSKSAQSLAAERKRSWKQTTKKPSL